MRKRKPRRLNHCFNGIVLNSDKEMDKYERKSLNPCFNGIVLNLPIGEKINNTDSCLNPCFNGIVLNYAVSLVKTGRRES